MILGIRRIFRRRPLQIFLLPFFLLGGRASFKERVARLSGIDPAVLPYREEILRFLREEKSRGRRLVLATAADRMIAEAVSQHVGIFDDVLSSDGTRNLKGRVKLEAIREHAQSGFGYMGDSMADLPILQAAEQAYLVHPAARLLTAAETACRIEKVFD